MILLKFIFKPNYKKKEIIRRVFWFLTRIRFGEFGKYSCIIKPLMIYNCKHIFIGEKVTIREGARIEPVIKWNGKTYNPRIYISDYTSIEQSFHLTCANRVYIGKYVTISGFVCITDIDHEYKNIEIGVLQQDIIVKDTNIEDYSFIGMGAKLMAGVKIGKHCIIGANSVVTKDIPDYSVAVGIPAKVIKKYNFESNKWERTNERGEFLNE